MTSNTALLIFAQTANVESGYKSILSGGRNQRVFKALNQHTAKKFKDCYLDTFCFTEKQQKGESFGERISHALADVFQHGYQNVIIVGNDCPDLSQSDVKTAYDELKTHQLVLGPDHRGGAYLIGISKKLFHQEAFEQLPWQTIETLPALLELTSESATLLLSSKQDLNDANDAEVLAQSSTIFYSILFLLIFIERHFKIFHSDRTMSVLKRSLPLRAPPQAA